MWPVRLRQNAQIFGFKRTEVIFKLNFFANIALNCNKI